MYVKNIVGYDIKIRYKPDINISIPFDGKIYSVPDDMTIFKEYLKVIRPFNIKNQKVPYIKKDGEVSNIKTNKRRGRPPKKKRDENKPLKGVKLKKKDGSPKKKRGRPRKNKTKKKD